MRRIIKLIDRHGEEFVMTDAPGRCIQEAINYRNELLESGKNFGDSEFRVIQGYLEKEGYIFECVNIEEYEW